MKKTDLAYIAGIIDGEGSICIADTARSGYVLVVSVGSTDEWLCQMLKMAFGGCVTLRNKKELHRSAFWGWSMGSNKARAMLETVLPYLHLKRSQAELAIEFQKAKRPVRAAKGRRGFLKQDKQYSVLEEAKCILMKSMNKANNGKFK